MFKHYTQPHLLKDHIQSCLLNAGDHIGNIGNYKKTQILRAS